MCNRGAFIVLEGVDRCGKSTQSRLLVDSLSRVSNNVERVVFPGRDRVFVSIATLNESCHPSFENMDLLELNSEWVVSDRTTPVGSLINSYLSKQTEMSDESMHLLFSANRWELK